MGKKLDYRAATTILFAPVTQDILADKMGLPRHRIMAARLPDNSGGRRPAPSGWEDAVKELAASRITALTELLKALP